MLRAVSSIYIEGQAFDLLSSTRRDVFKLFRSGARTVQPPRLAPLHTQTVLTSSGRDEAKQPPSVAAPPPPRAPPPPPPRAPPPPPAPARPPRYAWHAVATALAVTASLGGAYFYRKLNEDKVLPASRDPSTEEAGERDEDAPPPPIPDSGERFPKHVQYLLVGAGTASFAAMRAIRSARPDAHVLMVGEEPELPYMRPPLSKELWREAEPADPGALTFRQWNGRRRTVSYEPAAFYAPVEPEGGGAGVARGWRVERLDVVRHEAELRAPGAAPVLLRYDKCLVAGGVRPRRVPALRAAAAAGRSLPLRTARDATRLARELRRDDVRRVAVLGGGFLATELSAALAERLRGSGRAVLQLYREALPLSAVLPHYLAAEAARRLAGAGVTLLPEAEVVSSSVEGGESGEGAVRLRLASGGSLAADLVLECVGSEPDEELARRSQLETHPELGGVLVNAELQARADVYAAGDAACFYDVALGRRRVEHHDHAVLSGRLAGENMAAVGPPRPYTHQSMFWSDLGPQLGYEAIGIIDSRLPTVGVFSADAVSSTAATLTADGESTAATLTADGESTAATLTADGESTAATLTADGESTAATLTADGESTAATLTADGESTAATLTADGESTAATLTADGESTAATLTADGESSTAATLTADGESTAATLTADGESTAATLTADGESTAATLTADGESTAATLTADGESTAATTADVEAAEPQQEAAHEASSRRYERGVVFYLRDKRVVGVLLWNLFNRMHVARQVVAHGEFEDLFEVAKLFSLHEDE